MFLLIYPRIELPEPIAAICVTGCVTSDDAGLALNKKAAIILEKIAEKTTEKTNENFIASSSLPSPG